MKPRGGTTTGPDVTRAPRPAGELAAVREPGLSDRERDRRAILALAGEYRSTFDFIELYGFSPDFQPSQPYQSWGTEKIFIVSDEPEFIQLQHILVMHFVGDDGAVSEPVVVKHWRQDWRYQDTTLFVYAGNQTWERMSVTPDQAEGAWSQAVFQVDDSPRYEALGRWVHHLDHSTWTGRTTWRPLPRREFSERDDYHTLSGANRITLNAQGWVQEHDNLKVVLDAVGQPAHQQPFLARETGLSRYERIVEYDFSAGDAYWARTRPVWAEVRRAWRDIFAATDRFRLRSEVDGEPLFAAMFALADRLSGPSAGDVSVIQSHVRDTLDPYLVDVQPAAAAEHNQDP